MDAGLSRLGEICGRSVGVLTCLWGGKVAEKEVPCDARIFLSCLLRTRIFSGFMLGILSLVRFLGFRGLDMRLDLCP